MKAKNENGQIKLYATLPSKYKSDTLNVAGGFDKMSDKVHKAEGFFDLVIPDPSTYDTKLKTLGEIYFDSVNNVFTYLIADIQIDIEAKRTQLYEELYGVLDEISGIVSSVTNQYNPWGDTSGNIPQGFKDLVAQGKVLKQQGIDEIAALVTASDVVNYVVRGDQVNTLMTALKSYR